jgi:hypothetical protein
MSAPMNYVDPPDVPEGMTLRDYRRARAARSAAKRRVLRLPWQRRSTVIATLAARRAA